MTFDCFKEHYHSRIFSSVLCAVIFMGLSILCPGCGNSEESHAESVPEKDTEGASLEHYMKPELTNLEPAPTIATTLPPAPKPEGPLPPDASCITEQCHASYALAPQIHAPVAKRACDVCHGKDTGTHKYPLIRQEVEMCTFCHPVSSTKMFQHKPVKKGCIECHKPHISNTKFLLKGNSLDQSCAKCHRVQHKRHTHTILLRGTCSVCHTSHQSDYRFLLLGGDGPKHCYSCHESLRREVETAAYVHEPVAKKCNDCHDPHATEFTNQLKQPMYQMCLSCHKKLKAHLSQAKYSHGAIHKEKQCSICHDGHSSNHPDLLRNRMDKVCLGCHNEPVKTETGRIIPNMQPVLAESIFKHGPVRSGNCSQCHDPHGSNRENMLRNHFTKSFYAPFDAGNFKLCFDCHLQKMVTNPETDSFTGFRNGKVNLHFKHVNKSHKGRTCRTCHAIHGSNNPKHIAEEVKFEDSSWPMPMKFKKTPTGGRCTPGCHKTEAYDRNKPVARPVLKGNV